MPQSRSLSPGLTVSPVTLGVEVTQVEALLLAQVDVRRSARDLPRHERPAPTRALVVEEDTVARIHAVRLAVVDRDPVAVHLRDAIGRARVERRLLRLRRLDDLAVELGRRRLVEAHDLLEPARPDRVEQAQRAECIDVARVLGHLERDLDVRLRAQVVHLRRAHGRDDVHEVRRVRQVAVVQLELRVVTWRDTKIRLAISGRARKAYVRANRHRGRSDGRC